MKKIFADLLNGFTLTDLYLFFLTIFAAFFIGQLIRLAIKFSKSTMAVPSIYSIVIPVIVAMLVVLSKNSVPLSISMLGVLILTSSFINDLGNNQKLTILILAGAGFGCATGFILPTFLCYCAIIIPSIFILTKQNEK